MDEDGETAEDMLIAATRQSPAFAAWCDKVRVEMQHRGLQCNDPLIDTYEPPYEFLAGYSPDQSADAAMALVAGGGGWPPAITAAVPERVALVNLV